MAYKNLGTFLTRVTLKAISKLDESTSDECMRIATNVYNWASSETITEAQVSELLSALPVSVTTAFNTTDEIDESTADMNDTGTLIDEGTDDASDVSTLTNEIFE